MRAPKRVPWASRVELEELYDLIFSPSADVLTRKRGLSRINVYLSSPSCPAFLPLLHGLINASLLSAPSDAQETMTTRMTCAMAIIRFVNGMVDPLQIGAYARPISHLANTIGIPPILITIRHRATHDDLPSLAVLLNCVNMAIEYLHHYAFLPLLASTSETASSGLMLKTNTQAEGLVRRWKKVMKVRVRDKVVGEENETGREIRKIKRDLEVVDPEDIAVALCTVEGLIPLARKKRPSPKSTMPTTASLHVWEPLLDFLSDLHPSLSTILAEQIISSLLDPTPISASIGSGETDPAVQRKEEESARWCLSTWLLWLWKQEEGLRVDEEVKKTISKQILSALLNADVTRLHRNLIVLDSQLSDTAALNDLLPEVEEDELKGLDDVDMEDDADKKLNEMERRLRLLEQNQRPAAAIPAAKSDTSPKTSDLPHGWRRIENDFKPTPIGMWIRA